jgi:large subunit ribosomal protein L25
MKQPILAAQVRVGKGKGAARKLRRDDRIPAIFYGPKTEPIMLSIGQPDLRRVLKEGAGDNFLIDLQIQSGEGVQTHKAMLKEILADPLTGDCLHADFHQISMDKEITLDIPVHLINIPVGVSQNGGMLQHIRRELRIACMPDKLVSFIEVDVSALDVGEALHVRDMKLPEGIRSLDEDDLAIATVAAPSAKAERGEGEEEGAAAQGSEAEGAA